MKLDDLQKLCDAASPGPWQPWDCRLGKDGDYDVSEDSFFVAAARTAMPELIAEVRRLREALQKIYDYRSDKPDWNLVMAIAGDIIEPMEIVCSNQQREKE